MPDNNSLEEPSQKFVRRLTQELQQFHVDDEAVYWALRNLIIDGIPLTRADENEKAK